MATIQFPQYKKQQKLLIVLIVVILVIILVLYFGLWRQPSVSPEPFSPKTDESIIGPGVESENLELDTDFFQDPRYEILKFYGPWPIKVEETGRENPFLPY